VGGAEIILLIFAVLLTVALLVLTLRGWDHRHWQ
jgi:hypothetical protein